MNPPEAILPIRKVTNASAMCEIGLNLPLAGPKPQIAVGYMRPIVSALLVKQLCVFLQ